MAQLSNISRNQVFKIEYSFDDVEMSKHIVLVELVPSFHQVIEYLQKIENDNKILDNSMYKCRTNIHIKIIPDFISDKKYVSLFK